MANNYIYQWPVPVIQRNINNPEQGLDAVNKNYVDNTLAGIDATIAQANTWLQANDALTLSVAEAYTDQANLWLQANFAGENSAINQANTFLQGLISQANTFLQANDSLTLSVAEAYTDATNSWLRAAIADAANAANLELAYSYTNTAVSQANTYLSALIANNTSAIQNNVVAIANNASAIQNNTLAIQTANTFLQANDALTLSVAEAFTTQANNYLQALVANVAANGVTSQGSAGSIQLSDGNGMFLGSNSFSWTAGTGTVTTIGQYLSVWYNDTNATHPTLRSYNSRGSRGAPVAIEPGDDIFNVRAGAYTGTGPNTVDGVLGWSDQRLMWANVHSVTANNTRLPTDFTIQVVGTNDETRQFIFFNDGNFLVPNGISTAPGTDLTITAGDDAVGDNRTGNVIINSGASAAGVSGAVYLGSKDTASVNVGTILGVSANGIQFSDGTVQTTAALTANLQPALDYTNTAVSQANTWLQANDRLTLTTAETYTDSANAYLQTLIANVSNSHTQASGNVGAIQFAGSNGTFASSSNFNFESGSLLVGDVVADPNSIARFYGNNATYLQAELKNINSTGSTDWIITADNGTQTDGYVDVGIQNSQAPLSGILHPLDGYIFVRGVPGNSSNLVVGTDSVGSVKIISGSRSNQVAEFNANGLQLSSNTALTFGDGTVQRTAPKALFTSNVNSVQIGSKLIVTTDYSDPAYPAGKFVISQTQGAAVTFDQVWGVNNNGTKLAYIDRSNNIINTSNVIVSLAISGDTWNIQSGDDITIGTDVITGANLLSLAISGTGGTYVIPSSMIPSSVETTYSSPVTANLHSTTLGSLTLTGSTLYNQQPTDFATTINGAFANSSVPFWATNQNITWNVGTTGTVITGTLDIGGDVVTSNGQTSGTYGPVNSTQSIYVMSSVYLGTGLNGAGNTYSNGTFTIAQATEYTPMFTAITSNSANPNINTSSSHYTVDYVADGTQGVTSSTVNDYAWIAIPATAEQAPPLFKVVVSGFTGTISPNITYQNQTVAGVTYQVYGFTGLSNTFIYTKSN